jgi:hypothetical protein
MVPKPKGGKMALETLLEELRQHSESLVQDLAHAQREGSALAQELEYVTGQMATMANLYVQLRRLHASLRVADVVMAIDETLTNLVGSEDFALFLRDDGGRFEPLYACGTGEALPAFAIGEAGLGAALAAGANRFGGEYPAIVPLQSGLGDGCIGALVVTGLLAHKTELLPLDRTLLEVLGEHAGVAIEAALSAAAVGSPRRNVAELRAQLAAGPARPSLHLVDPSGRP